MRVESVSTSSCSRVHVRLQCALENDPVGHRSPLISSWAPTRSLHCSVTLGKFTFHGNDINDNSFILTSQKQSFQESVQSEMITFGAKEVFGTGASLQGPESLLGLEGKLMPQFTSLVCLLSTVPPSSGLSVSAWVRGPHRPWIQAPLPGYSCELHFLENSRMFGMEIHPASYTVLSRISHFLSQAGLQSCPSCTKEIPLCRLIANQVNVPCFYDSFLFLFEMQCCHVA